MKMNFRLGDASAPFAHLLGLGRRAEQPRAETDEDKDKAVAAAATVVTITAAAKRAQEDDERDEPQDDGETDDGDDVEEEEERDSRKGKKGKRSRRAEEDDDKDKDAGVDGENDDPDDEMHGHSPLAKARRRERARCESIFACKAAAERPDVAASVAFRTTMSRKEAITVLTDTAAGQAVRPVRLADRMAEVKAPQIGPEANGGAPANLTPTAAGIIAAGERARGL